MIMVLAFFILFLRLFSCLFNSIQFCYLHSFIKVLMVCYVILWCDVMFFRQLELFARLFVAETWAVAATKNMWRKWLTGRSTLWVCVVFPLSSLWLTSVSSLPMATTSPPPTASLTWRTESRSTLGLALTVRCLIPSAGRNARLKWRPMKSKQNLHTVHVPSHSST